jgi:hypothetical protein
MKDRQRNLDSLGESLNQHKDEKEDNERKLGDFNQ